MAATATVTTRYNYNPRTMRYRDNVTGRFVRPATVKRATTAVIRKSRERMRALSRDMADRKISLKNWQEQFAAELKSLHVSAAMVGRGGLSAMTPADYGRVGARLRFEYARLAEFARSLRNREFTEKALMARVEMYCNAGHVSLESARRDAAVGADMDEERNNLGARDKHCTTGDGTRVGCVNVTKWGWVPIGTVPAVGQRRCLSNCGCWLSYRKRKRPREAGGVG